MSKKEAGYSVGGLNIAFNTLNKTDEDFSVIIKNLQKVKNLLVKVGQVDMTPISKNIKQITKDFSPFLINIQASTDGLNALNNVLNKITSKKFNNIEALLEKMKEPTAEKTNSLSPNVYGLETSLAKYQEFSLANENLSKELGFVREDIEEISYTIEDTTVNFDGWFKGLNSSIQTTKSAMADLITYNLQNGRHLSPTSEQNSFSAQDKEDLLGYVEQYQNLNGILKEVNETIRILEMTEDEKTIAQYKAIEAERQHQIELLNAKIALSSSAAEIKKYTRELKKLQKEDDKVKKKKGLSKFLERVKAITVSNLIYSGIKKITSAFKDSISAFAGYDDGVNTTMSEITTSISTIKASVGASIIPVLEAISPILQEIAVAAANFANKISAAMSTTGTYTKINTDRLLEYSKAAQEANSLYDFDKFRVASGSSSSSMSDLFSTEQVDENNESLEQTRTTYNSIKEVVSSIGQVLLSVGTILGTIWEIVSPFVPYVLQLVSWIAQGLSIAIQWLDKIGALKVILIAVAAVIAGIGIYKLIGAITKVPSLLSKIGGGIKTLITGLGTTAGLIAGIIAAIAVLVVGVATFVKNFNQMGTLAKVLIPVLATLAAVVFGIAAATIATKLHIASAPVIGIVAGAIAAGAVLIGGTLKATKYATGGQPDKGSLFVAGEAGAEIVYDTPSGQSGVVNIQQIREAVHYGMLDFYSDIGGSGSGNEKISVEVNGRTLFDLVVEEGRRRGINLTKR